MVVSTLFLDIKSTFPSVVLRLIHDMRTRGVPVHQLDHTKTKRMAYNPQI